MAQGTKVSQYSVTDALTGSEKIPLGVGVKKATTPDQLADHTSRAVNRSKLNSIVVVEDFLHSSPANMTFTGFSVVDFSDTQLNAITGANLWKGAKVLRYGTASSTSHNLQVFGATSIAGSASYVVQWNAGDNFQMQQVFALPVVSSVGNEYSFGVGFAHVTMSNPQNPSTAAGAANAYLYTNATTGRWHAYSSVAASSQDTDTGIAVVALTSITAAVVIRADGVVEFYLDSVLVATHSAAGAITDGTQLNPCLSWFNIGTQSLATTSRNLYVDLFAYKLDFSGRQFAWI